MSELSEYRNRTMKNYSLTIEYKHLQRHAPGGVYVLPSYDDIRTWHGVVFVRQGVYRDGVFKFKLIIPDDYPADGARPHVVFTTPLFHPMVYPNTGELDLTKKFKTWTEGEDYLVSVLAYIKKIFYLKSYDIENAANQRAVDVFRSGGEKKTAFVAEVNRCVRRALDTAYDKGVGNEKVPFSFSRPSPVHKKYFDMLMSDRGTADAPTPPFQTPEKKAPTTKES